MELKEAIEVLKRNRPLIGRIGDEAMEAIDTVVAELEKTTYTAEETQDFAEWSSKRKWFYDDDGKWYNEEAKWIDNEPVGFTTAQLREMWEKGRKEATE